MQLFRDKDRADSCSGAWARTIMCTAHRRTTLGEIVSLRRRGRRREARSLKKRRLWASAVRERLEIHSAFAFVCCGLISRGQLSAIRPRCRLGYVRAPETRFQQPDPLISSHPSSIHHIVCLIFLLPPGELLVLFPSGSTSSLASLLLSSLSLNWPTSVLLPFFSARSSSASMNR